MEGQDHPSLSPMLGAPNSEEAAAFYARAFGAKREGAWLTTPDGLCAFGQLRIGDAVIMLCDLAFGAAPSPKEIGDTTVRLSLIVEDVDAVFARAREAGAEILIEPADQFFGQRSGRLRDPFGHIWVVGEWKEHVSPEEMQRRFTAMLTQQG